MAELVNVNVLGVTKGSEVEEAVKANFQGETAEVGLYLAMSRQAQREGLPEIAEALTRPEIRSRYESRVAPFSSAISAKI